jgi:histone deacetylase complex regulatory component SIN3
MIIKKTMTEDIERKTKKCPCCLKERLIETGKFIVGRARGRTTSTWKCAECLSFSNIKKASLKS